MRRPIMIGIVGGFCLLPIQASTEEADLVTHKTLSLRLASDLAEAAGSIVAGVGVSGAPGGVEDDLCANAGVEAVADRLEF